jgi:hypothetical protein
VDFELTEDQATIRRAAAKFDDRYWMQKDAAHEFPTHRARLRYLSSHQRRSKAP